LVSQPRLISLACS